MNQMKVYLMFKAQSLLSLELYSDKKWDDRLHECLYCSS